MQAYHAAVSFLVCFCVYSLPAGATVAYLKLLIQQQHGFPIGQQVLTLSEKTLLLDPFSLCDLPGLQPGCKATVRVQVN
jgi:hypothetical protein